MIYILILGISILWRQRRPRAGRSRRSDSRRRGRHPGPRGHHRPALGPMADPAGLAQGPGAGDDRHARGPGRLRPVPADAELLAARRPDDGAADDEEHRAADLHPDPHLRALRPEELATRRAVVGPLALLPFATLLRAGPAAPRGDGVARRGWRKSETPRTLLFSFDALILSSWPSARHSGPARSPGCAGRWPRPGNSASIASGRRIGAGGMGEVYLAEHQLLKRPCAVKLIRPGDRGRPEGAGAVRARGPAHRHALAPEHRRDLRLRPGRGRHLLLRHGVPAGPEPGRAGRASRPAAAGAGGLPAAAGLRGAARGARGGPDPPRHQAVEHLRRAARRDGRRGQAARLRPGPARRDVPRAPT